MPRIVVEKQIAAPLPTVFQTVADIRCFSEALPHVVNYEFLGSDDIRVGTRFRETRVMNGSELTTELEITEYRLNEHVRMVADSHGAVWDTLFQVEEDGPNAKLTLTMDARPYKLMPRLMIPLTKGMIGKAIDRDMDLVKEHCESKAKADE